ncbi:MAG: GatB/YqeY domain-containing protein [Myxococcota bacterium]
MSGTTIFDQVSEQLKDAMRSKDKDRLNGLRGIRAAFIEALKLDGSTTLSDDAALDVLRRLAKQRKESIEAYEAGARADLVAEEKRDLAVIEAFLPKLADEATTLAWVRAAIAETGATTGKDLGKVMGALTAAHRGQYDGKLANKLVREALGG